MTRCLRLQAGVKALAQFAERSPSLTGIRVAGCYDDEGWFIEPSREAMLSLEGVEGVEVDR